MKKLIMLGAMVALVAIVSVVPALAQGYHRFDRFAAKKNVGISQVTNQQSQSGDVATGYRIANSGDYASQCAPAIQFGNSGNFSNAPGFVQVGSAADDFQPGGISVSFSPQMAVKCPSTIQQSSAAYGS